MCEKQNSLTYQVKPSSWMCDVGSSHLFRATPLRKSEPEKRSHRGGIPQPSNLRRASSVPTEERELSNELLFFHGCAESSAGLPSGRKTNADLLTSPLKPPRDKRRGTMSLLDLKSSVSKRPLQLSICSGESQCH